MKSKMKRRMLAIVLCMVIVLSNSSFIFASSESGTPAVEAAGTGETAAQTETDTQVPETTTEVTTQSVAEPTPAPTEEPTVPTSEEPTATPEPTQAPTAAPEVTATPEPTQTPTPEATTTPAPTDIPEVTTTPAPTDIPETTATPEPTQVPENGTSDNAQPTETPTPTEDPDESDQTNPLPFEGTYEDDTVEIHVSAEAGIVPEAAELSVTPIEKTEITDDMSAEDKAKAEEINAQYDLTEKKLTEDSEENEEIMEGFLAYDISFLANGEAVEPNGDVKVVMDFREAAIPEGVSEDTDIAVKHLKTDDDAVDGVVVEDMAEKATIQTTDSAEVEKVEFTSDSFSTYTIQWKNRYQTLKVEVVNTNGTGISNDTTIKLSKTADTVSNIADQFSLSGYRFIGAFINSYSSATGGTSIERLRYNYNNRKNQYSTKLTGDKKSDWNDINNSTVYFVFESNLPGTVETADTSDFIELSLFDYVVGDSTNNYDEYNQANNRPGTYNDGTGINKDHALKFQTNSDGWDLTSINKSGQNGQPNTGIVNPTLGADGFPVLNPEKTDSDGKSLNYLFNNTSTNYKSVHTGLNHLFQYNSTTRQYSYDSDKNYAYLDAQNNATNFVVYDRWADITNKDQTTKGFFPFSKYESVHGSERGPKTGVTLDCNDRQNHYFGMEMRTRFMQPKNGMITQNDKMVFSFSGDDDVWVYIDGVLVMDIGGSHGAISGTIDFTTGEVVVANRTQGYIGDLLKDNGVDESKLNITTDSDGNKISTLKDYEEFDLDFFYLERGNWDSNCKLEFNLAMINKNSVSVGKEITDVDTSKYEDVEFEFLIEVGEDESSLSPHKNQVYKIYNLDTRTYTGTTGRTDNEGHFKLKHNQLAIFEEDSEAGSNGIDENLCYRVTELNVNSQEYNEIYINQTTIRSEGYDETVNDDGTISGNEQNKVYHAESPIYQVSDTGRVIFYNRCSEYNKRELHIRKEMSSGETQDKFDMTVTLGSELYSGRYFLVSADGTQTPETATNGVIALGVGQEAVIDDIPAGTTFRIVEEELNPAEYNAPTYEVTNGGDSPVTTGEASGVTVSGADTKVIVTNSEYVYVPIPAEEEVPHSKQIDYLGDGTTNPDTKLAGDYYYRLYLSATGIPTVEPDPADILLVLDYSSSMKNTYGTGTRMEAVKASATTAVNTLLPEGSSNRVGIVWFDRTATDNINLNFTDDKNALLRNINNREWDSGTNYQSAFIVAQKMLEENRITGRNQYVIFVTDGEPYQWVNSSGKIESSGTDDAKTHAIEQAKEFVGLSGFYAVSVGKEAGMTFLQTLVGNVSAGIKDTIEANDEEQLVSTFQKILGSITRQISNVTITDDLSKYVEFVDEAGKTLTEQEVSGTISEENIALKVTKKDKDGTEKTLNAGTDYTYQISSEGTISVNFGQDYFLDPGATYTVSFNVKLTDEAFTDYVSNGGGYGGNKGDDLTDYGNNTTSSGEDGFDSNDKATFTYTVDENGEPDEKTGDYDKPVVQVSDRIAWNLIKKSDTVGSDIRLDGAEFTLTNGTITYTGVSLAEDTNTEKIELGYIEWRDSSGNVVQEKDIPAGTYTLTETKAPDGYTLSTVSWRVTVRNMTEPEICPINSDGTFGTALDGVTEDEGDNKIYQIVITNTPLYDLPSAGSSGIFGYTMGGTLLLMAGTLILYKMKRREVQES